MSVAQAVQQQPFAQGAPNVEVLQVNVTPDLSPYARVRNHHAREQYNAKINVITESFQQLSIQLVTWTTRSREVWRAWAEDKTIEDLTLRAADFTTRTAAYKTEFDTEFRTFMVFHKTFKETHELLVLLENTVQFSQAAELDEQTWRLVWETLNKLKVDVPASQKAMKTDLESDPAYLQKLIVGDSRSQGLRKLEADFAKKLSAAKCELECWARKSKESEPKYFESIKEQTKYWLFSTPYMDKEISKAEKAAPVQPAPVQ